MCVALPKEPMTSTAATFIPKDTFANVSTAVKIIDMS